MLNCLTVEAFNCGWFDLRIILVNSRWFIKLFIWFELAKMSLLSILTNGRRFPPVVRSGRYATHRPTDGYTQPYRRFYAKISIVASHSRRPLGN